MASIQKRGNSYRVTVSNGYDINGKKITETATYTPEPGMTQKQIQKALNEFVVDFERDVKYGKNIKGGKMTFQELAKLFMEDMKPPELARTTYSDYRRRLDQRILLAIGHMKIGMINPKTIKNYKTMLAENYERKGRRNGGPLKESTVRKDCCTISSILSYGVWEGYLTINPLIYAGKRRGKRQAAKEYRVQYFTMAQLIRFIDALESDMFIIRKERTCKRKNGTVYTVPECRQPFKVSTKWKLFFYLLIFCGDRRGENISLTWNDFDFSTGTVTIDKSTSYVDGVTEINDTKTHNVRDNTVPPYIVSIAKNSVLKKWNAASHWVLIGKATVARSSTKILFLPRTMAHRCISAVPITCTKKSSGFTIPASPKKRKSRFQTISLCMV